MDEDRSCDNAQWNAVRLHCLSYGLGGVLADYAVCVYRDRRAVAHRVPACVLDRVFETALEVPGRGDRWFADRAAANCARPLYSDRFGTARPIGAVVASDDRTHAGVHLRRIGRRVRAL